MNDSRNGVSLTQFLPRLYWISAATVEAAGGTFIKWTGDGFLAWFETTTASDAGRMAALTFHAATQLSLLVNSTQLGVRAKRRLTLRHGIAYEHRALVTRIGYDDGHSAIDLAGRATVLAFRLSGIRAGFPSVVTQQGLATSSGRHDTELEFVPIEIQDADRQKYFKGERWGTSDLCTLSFGASPRRRLPLRKSLRSAHRLVSQVEGGAASAPWKLTFAQRWLRAMDRGPEWLRAVRDSQEALNRKMFEILKKVTREHAPAKPR